MHIGDFFKVKSDGEDVRDFEVLNRLHCLVQEKKQSKEYHTVCLQLKQIEDRLKEIKGIKDTSDEKLIAEKMELRKQKKMLQETKSVLESKYFKQSTEEIKKNLALVIPIWNTRIHFTVQVLLRQLLCCLRSETSILPS